MANVSLILLLTIIGDEPSALFLLDHGADANILDYNKNTAMHLILTKRHEDMLDVANKLLERGALLDAQDKDMM